jgi:hypothetical protein
VIFEIARSEIGYTEQRPAEYAAVMLAAAIREGWTGPFFLQGDHYQTNPKKMAEDPEKELSAIQALIDEAIPAGFLQIDIDTSTLVDLSKPTLEAQQDVNATLCARLTKFIRSREPKSMPISVGGEIGEVGKENSTPDEFRAYMNVYRRRPRRRHPRDRQGLGSDRLLARRPRRTGRHGRARGDRLLGPQEHLEGRPARSTGWRARSSMARPPFLRSTSATFPTTTARRSTSRPTS